MPIYQLVVNTNIGGQFASNVLHFEFDDSGYGTTAQAGLALCNGWVAGGGDGAFRDLCSVHTQFLSLRARKINSVGGFEGQRGYAAGTFGSRPGNLSASGVSAVIVLIPTGNAKERGRIFLPGLSDTDCVDGQLQAGFLLAGTAAHATMLAPFVLAGGGAPTAQIRLYSRKLRLVRTIQLMQTSVMVGQIRRRQVPV